MKRRDPHGAQAVARPTSNTAPMATAMGAVEAAMGAASASEAAAVAFVAFVALRPAVAFEALRAEAL